MKSSEVDAKVGMGASLFRFKSNLTSYSHISWKKLTLISSRFMWRKKSSVLIVSNERCWIKFDHLGYTCLYFALSSTMMGFTTGQWTEHDNVIKTNEVHIIHTADTSPENIKSNVSDKTQTGSGFLAIPKIWTILMIFWVLSYCLNSFILKLHCNSCDVAHILYYCSSSCCVFVRTSVSLRHSSRKKTNTCQTSPIYMSSTINFII